MAQMWQDFTIDCASVIGRLHTEKLMNNQDNRTIIFADEFFIGIVSDGCSASPHSEVGSYLVSRLIANAILDRLGTVIGPFKSDTKTMEDVTDLMEDVRLDVSSYLRGFASHLGESMSVMMDCLLATASGFVVTQNFAWMFSIGDGMFFLNDKPIWLDNEHAKYPDMVVYGVMDPKCLNIAPKKFMISEGIPLSSIKSIAVATDGLEHFINAEGKEFPGKKELIPSLSELWKPEKLTQDIFRKMAKTVYRSEYDKSLDISTQTVSKSPLLDDTTIIILKR